MDGLLWTLGMDGPCARMGPRLGWALDMAPLNPWNGYTLSMNDPWALMAPMEPVDEWALGMDGLPWLLRIDGP